MKNKGSLSKRLLEGVFVGFGIGIGVTLFQLGLAASTYFFSF